MATHTTAKRGWQLQLALLLAVLGMVAATSGCVKRRVQAAPPVIVPSPSEEAAPATPRPEAKPSTPPETNPPAPALVVPTPKNPPPRREPRTTPPANLQPEPPPPVVAPPQISPRLSAQEQAEAERRTSDDISLAERNLLLAPDGKQLSVAQRDLVEKIRGFLAQAREAIRASDWVRARTLAQKARVLSIELVNSL
jgi:hypothetical protein